MALTTAAAAAAAAGIRREITVPAWHTTGGGTLVSWGQRNP